MSVTPEAYAKIAASTAIYPKEQLGYPVLGVVDETGEFVEAVLAKDPDRVKKEAGDVIWYIAETCNVHGIVFSQVFLHWGGVSPKVASLGTLLIDSPSDGFLRLLAQCAGLQKKQIRDGSIDVHALQARLSEIATAIAACLHAFDLTIEEAAEANNWKLLDRQARGQLQGSGDER